MVQMCLYVCGTLIDIMCESQQLNSMVQHVNVHECKCISCRMRACNTSHNLVIIGFISEVYSLYLYLIRFQWVIQLNANIDQMLRWWTFSPWRIVGFQNSMHLLFRSNWQMYVNVLAGFKKWNEAAHLFRSVMCHKARASLLSSLLHGAGMTSIIKRQF